MGAVGEPSSVLNRALMALDEAVSLITISFHFMHPLLKLVPEGEM